jgi:hypothetical protein
VAWVENDRAALAYFAPGTGIAIVDVAGSAVADLALQDDPACRGREFRALGRTLDGLLGYADLCDAVAGRRVEFAVRDIDAEQGKAMGAGSGEPYDSAWTLEDAAVYSTGDLLCSTLYRHHAFVDEPIEMTVEVDGERFGVGQDVGSTPDGCPVGGRAGFPAFDRAGTSFAFLASSDGGKVGQELLHRPWTLFVVTDGGPVAIFDSLLDPRDLDWASEGRLVFAASVEGRLGIWTIEADGGALTLIAEVDALDLAVSPRGGSAIAILSSFITGQPDVTDSGVVVFDLPAT